MRGVALLLSISLVFIIGYNCDSKFYNFTKTLTHIKNGFYIGIFHTPAYL